MRIILQRVRRGSVSVDSRVVGAVEQGFVALVGVTHGDTHAEAELLARKTANLRVFEDDAGKMNLSVLDMGGGVLVISQFTLYADTRKGRRPSFTDAAPPDQAEALFNHTVALFKASGLKVETGKFQAHMLVSIHNDGPVTIMIDSADRERPRRG